MARYDRKTRALANITIEFNMKLQCIALKIGKKNARLIIYFTHTHTIIINQNSTFRCNTLILTFKNGMRMRKSERERERQNKSHIHQTEQLDMRCGYEWNRLIQIKPKWKTNIFFYFDVTDHHHLFDVMEYVGHCLLKRGKYTHFFDAILYSLFLFFFSSALVFLSRPHTNRLHTNFSLIQRIVINKIKSNPYETTEKKNLLFFLWYFQSKYRRIWCR